MAKHTPRFLQIVTDAKSRVKECTVDDAKAMLEAAAKNCLLIDVREESEFRRQFHLPGAIHLGKGVIIERDIEERNSRPTRSQAHSLLWRRLSLFAGRGQLAENGLHQRDLDGRRFSRLAREKLSAHHGLNEAQLACSQKFFENVLANAIGAGVK